MDSLNNIKMRISNSSLNLNKLNYDGDIQGFKGRGSMGNLRRSMVGMGDQEIEVISQNSGSNLDGSFHQAASFQVNPFLLAHIEDEDEMFDAGEIQGKIKDYLEKLNDILSQYEKQRVIESSLLNMGKFNRML